MNRSGETFFLKVMRIGTLAAILVLAGHLHAFAQAKLDHRLTVNLPDCQLGDVIQALADMTGAKIVFPPEVDDPDRVVSLHIKDGALADALDALGLAWETRDDIIVVKGMKPPEPAAEGPQAEIAVAYGLHRSWGIWRGDLPREVAGQQFVPEAMKLAEDGARLQGTLADLVADLQQAGLGMSIDPGAPESVAEATIEVAWRADATTVEQALLRGLVSALGEQVDLVVIQRRKADGALLPMLRIVARRQTYGARPTSTAVVPFRAPDVFYDQHGRRTVVYPNAAGFVELADGTRLPTNLKSDLVTIRTEDAPLRDLVNMLSQACGMSIAIHDDVDSELTVTLRAEDMPVLTALGALVDQAGLGIEIQTDDEGQFQSFLIVPRRKTSNAVRVCPDDRTVLRADWLFCPTCGKPTDVEPEQASPATAAPDDQPDR